MQQFNFRAQSLSWTSGQVPLSSFEDRRAQGTIEYLVIIAIVIVISLVVVGLVISQADSASNISSQVSSIAQVAGIVSVSDVVIDSTGEGLIVVTNNSGEYLSVTSLSFGGSDYNYNTSIVQGDKKSFRIPNVGESCSCIGYEGKKRNCETTIQTTSQYGLEKNYTTTLVIDCVNTATLRDPEKLIQPSAYLALGADCNENYQCFDGYCETYSANVCTDGSAGEYCATNDECATGWCGMEWNNYEQVCINGLVGDGCINNSSCILGYCDEAWYNAEPYCTDGEIGSYCNAGDDCISGYCGDNYYYVCTDGSVGSDCWSNSACASGYCDSYNAQCSDGNIGSGCYYGSNCVSGYCDNYMNYQCTDGNLGQFCGDNSSCSSGYCGYDGTDQVCTTGILEAGCYSNSSCISNYCDTVNYQCTDGSLTSSCAANNQCQSNYCDTYLNYQCTDGSNGSSCAANNQCSSGICSSVTHLCVSGIVGSSCTLASECSSGYCDTYNEICTDGNIGDGCGSGSDCQGGICSSLSNTCSLGETGSACTLDSDCATGHCSDSNICEIMPLSTGLVGYWSFDNNLGSTVYDGTINGNNGTLAGNSYVNTNGKLGSATTYDGSGDRMSIPNRALFKIQNFTFSAWVKKSSTRWNEVVYLHQGNGWNVGWRIFVRSSSGPVTYSWGNGSIFKGEVTTSSGVFSTNQWFHLAVVVDEGMYVNIYINGVLKKRQLTNAIGYSATTASYTAYGDSAGADGFTGSIDEIGFWNRTLSAYDVNQLYNSGNGLDLNSF